MRSPEAKSAKFIDAGKKLLQKSDTTRAILEFRNAVQATPKNPEAYYQLSLAYLAAGDLKMGVASLRKALELNPKHAAARLRMAQLMSMASDPALVKDARQRLQQMLEETPDDPDALHALAFTELKLGQPEDAIQHLGRAMMLAPSDITLAVSMAEAKLQQKDSKGAEEVLRKTVQNSPKSSAAAMILGRFLTLQKRWPEAQQEFQRAVSLNPNNGAALLDLANLHYAQGRKAEAEQGFRRLAALPDKRFKSMHALFLFQEGKRDDAIREFEKLAKDDPEDRQVRTRLIAAYRSGGRPADAEKLLHEALKKNPKDTDALLQRAETLIAAGKYDKAEVDLNQAFHMQPDSAIISYVMAKLHQARGTPLLYRQDLLKALQLDPTLLPVRLEAVQALLTSKDPKTAIGLLDETPDAQKDLPEVLVQRNWALWMAEDMPGMRKGVDRGLSRARTPDLLLQDGMWNLRAGKFAEARKSLEEALKINPADLRSLTALRESYLAQKQSQIAVQRIKEYAAQHPTSAPVQEFLGATLMSSGDNIHAREALIAAKAADPHSINVDTALIRLDFVENKWEDAASKLTAILSADPRNVNARLWLGELEALRGNYDSAIAHLRQVATAAPNNADALNNLAYLLADSGKQLDEALAYAQKAQRLSPEDPDFADTVGWALYQKGLYAPAIQQLERSTARGGDSVALYHLAMACAKAGEAKRARSVLATALKKYPNAAEAKRAADIVGK